MQFKLFHINLLRNTINITKAVIKYLIEYNKDIFINKKNERYKGNIFFRSNGAKTNNSINLIIKNLCLFIINL